MDDNNQFLNNTLIRKILIDRANKLKPEYTEDSSKYDDFLKAISGVESSFGQNTQHPEIQEGIHAGDSAIGQYGVMPETAIDISNKLGNLKSDLGQYMQQVDLPEVKQLGSLDKEQVKEKMQDPKIMQQLVRLLATQQDLKQQGDEDRMAYTWNQGSNIPKEDISDEDLNKSKYVNEFRKTRKLIGK